MQTAPRILLAAQAELLVTDPGSLRVDRIADVAGVNKRMIYHYFGDRDGLLRALYGLQMQRLLAPGAPISAATREIVAALLGSDLAETGKGQQAIDTLLADEAIAPRHLQIAARILLPYLTLRGRPYADEHNRVKAAVWVSFCVELMSLALAHAAPVEFPAEPGSAAFAEVSKHLLTPKKPTVRLMPDSRSRPGRA